MRNTKSYQKKNPHKKFLKIFHKPTPLKHPLTFSFLKSLVSKSFKDINNPLTCFSRKAGIQKF